MNSVRRILTLPGPPLLCVLLVASAANGAMREPSSLRTQPGTGGSQDATAAVESVREKRSKVDFPVVLAPVGGAKESKAHRLAGFGLRTKTIFDVKVYAMALYVDPETTLTALDPWKGKNQDTLESDSKVYEALLKPANGKTLRLVMRRDVDADDMRDAFEDALEPRVARAAREFGMPGGENALRVFRTFFDVDELKEDQILDFSWHPATGTSPGRLVTRVGGRVKPAVENAALAWALFDVYLGGDPIHKKEKPRMVRRLAKLLAG